MSLRVCVYKHMYKFLLRVPFQTILKGFIQEFSSAKFIKMLNIIIIKV